MPADNSSSDGTSRGPIGSGNYVVQRGDCVSSIAFRHGHLWETIWNHPANDELKKVRKDPNVLLAGDQLFIPELKTKDQSCGTDAKHIFQVRGVPAKLRLQFFAEEQPRANEKFSVEVDAVKVGQGELDQDGRLEVSIPPIAREAVVYVGEGPTLSTYTLALGGVDPVSEITGVQQRLANLGFHCEPSGEFDEDTRDAISRFQESRGLRATGESDSDLRNELVKSHGC